MKNICVLVTSGLFCVLGCQRTQDPTIYARVAPSDMRVNPQDNVEPYRRVNAIGVSDGLRMRGRVKLLWDEKFLWVRIECPTHQVVWQRFCVQLDFDAGGGSNRCRIVLVNGKCFDPDVSSVGLVELTPKEAVCDSVVKGKTWICEARISLVAIRAIGHRTVVTFQVRGRRSADAKDGPGAFQAEWSGAIHFEYPKRDRSGSRPVRPHELYRAVDPSTRPGG